MNSASLEQRSAVALAWSYGGAVARVLAQTVVQLLLARFLGPDAFGQATTAFFVLSLGWLMSECGFGSALVQKADLAEGDVSYALGWVLLVSGGTGAAVVLGAPWIALALSDATLAPLIAACGAIIPLQAVSNIPVSLMRRNLDMKRAQVVYLGGYLVSYGLVGLPMAAYGAGAWSLVAAFGCHSATNLLGSYAVVRHTLRPRLYGHPALRAFGLKVTATTIANWGIENIDRLLIQRLWGTAALGEYAAAAALSRAPANFLVSSMQSVLFASTSRLQDDPARAAKAFASVLRLLGLVTFPVFVLLAFQADLVVHLLYGERWTQAAPLFSAFCLSLPFYAVISVTGPLLWAFNAVERDLHTQLLGAAALFVGFVSLAGVPLAQAIWCVPLVYAARTALMLRAVTACLPLAPRQAWHALRPGALLALLVATTSALTRQTGLVPIVEAALSLTVALLVCGMALRSAPRWMWGDDLQTWMLSRAAGSPLVARLCATLNLRHASL